MLSNPFSGGHVKFWKHTSGTVARLFCPLVAGLCRGPDFLIC